MKSQPCKHEGCSYKASKGEYCKTHDPNEVIKRTLKRNIIACENEKRKIENEIKTLLRDGLCDDLPFRERYTIQLVEDVMMGRTCPSRDVVLRLKVLFSRLDKERKKLAILENEGK